MKNIAEHMSFYEAYHKHPLNKATHFVGIPMIIYGILVPMSALGVPVGGVSITLAMAFVVSVLTYYCVLDRTFGIAMCLVITPILALAHFTVQQGTALWIAVALGAFVLGWVFQLFGHIVFEKRRPALADNLFQLIIGPLFLCAELFFMMGFKKALHTRVLELAKGHALKQPEVA